MDAKATELMEEAIEHKRDGRLPEARDAYSRAITHALEEPVLYYGLAKVNYLLGEKNEAISSYMRAAHLSYNHMKDAITGKQGLEGQLVQERLAAMDKELLAALNEISCFAPLLMLDENMARNLGHALVDLGQDVPQELEEVISLYRRALQSGEEPDEQAKEVMSKLDDELYLPTGREYLAENVLWEMVGDGEVSRMY